MAARQRSAGGEGIEETLSKLLPKLQDGLRVAQENGGTGARATIDSQNTTIRTLEASLAAAHKREVELQELIKAQFCDWANVLKKNAEASKLDANERVKIESIKADAEFKKELVRAVGPAAPAALNALLKKLGLASEGDGLLLNPGQDEIGLDRAAFWEVINTIAVRPDLQKSLSDAVGPDKWARCMQHLEREYHAQAKAASEEAAKVNGAAN